MPKRDSEVHDDVICGQNKAYNIRNDEDVTWDKSEIREILIDK